RCAGWAVADVLYHELLDARRALRTFASPADQPPDCDDVSYWTDYAPGGDGTSGGAAPAYAEESAAHARYVRIAAAAYPPGALACRHRRSRGHRPRSPHRGGPPGPGPGGRPVPPLRLKRVFSSP